MTLETELLLVRIKELESRVGKLEENSHAPVNLLPAVTEIVREILREEKKPERMGGPGKYRVDYESFPP